MSGPAAVLREIHRLRKHAGDLKGKIDQTPRLLQGQKAGVARQEEALRQAQDELKKLKVHTHEKEVSLKTTDEQIKKYEKQLSDIISKKEYDALKLELAHARQLQQKLEDEILANMAEIEEKAARIPELEQALRQTRAQADTFARESEARLADLTGQREQVLRQLAEVEATLPPDLKPQYDRLIGARGEDAMSLVQTPSRTCSACYTEITAQSYNDLLLGNFVLCKNCDRILYLAQE